MAPDRPHRAAVAVAAVWQGSAMPAAPPALELAWDQVVGWRLRRHHLDERAPGGDLLAVVAEIAGLHAQIMSSAELTLWARVEGLDRGAVRDALWRDRSLVKTWTMRGTLHLLPAAEFPALAGRPQHPARLPAGGLAARLRRHPGGAAVDAARDHAGAGRQGALPRGAGGRGQPHHRLRRAGGQAA